MRCYDDRLAFSRERRSVELSGEVTVVSKGRIADFVLATNVLPSVPLPLLSRSR